MAPAFKFRIQKSIDAGKNRIRICNPRPEGYHIRVIMLTGKPGHFYACAQGRAHLGKAVGGNRNADP